MDLFNKIAISGKIASGKTTVSDYLHDELGYVQIRSAEYLKRICKDMAKLNLLESSEANINTSIIEKSLNKDINFISNSKEEEELIRYKIDELRTRFSHVKSTDRKTDDVREMLQIVANVLLNEVRQDIWVGSAIKTMKSLQKEGLHKFVHDDIRYPFEFSALRKEGFVLFRMDITEVTQSKRIKKIYGDIAPERLTHISEIALDRHVFDYNFSSEIPLDDMLNEIKETVVGGDLDVSWTRPGMDK